MGRIIDSYYEDVSQDIVVDKSRGWIAYFELFENIIPDMKVVVPVRDVRDVLASFEKLRRKQIDMKIPVGEGENFIKFQTTAGRCEYWLQPEQPVGLAINRIEDAIIRGYRDRMLFVEYDDLCREPKETMDRIYDFWGLSNYAHNFDNVEQVTHEDDRVHGFGTSDALHTIKNKVEYIPSDAGVKYLGKRVSEFYSGISRFWRTL
jgi:sulfotransferase